MRTMRSTSMVTVPFVVNIISLMIRSTHGENSNDFDEMKHFPGSLFEFKIDIRPGYAECFFQKMKQGSILHMTFQVLRGADHNIDVYIKRPDGTLLDQHLWTNEGHTEMTIQREGDYAICIDNGMSRFSTKLVHLFVSTYVETEWQTFIDEIQSIDTSLDRTQKALDGVRSRVAKMAHLMGLGRGRSGKDYYIALTNNETVQNMSILSICVFILTSAIQLYFVKHMFKTVNVTPTQKPRA